jgi:plasmid stabilization system protein ParE
MNPRVILRPQVPDDLESILRYLAERSPAAADRFADAIQLTLEELARMPRVGSPKHFATPALANVRSWSVRGFRKYLILYKPIPDGILVLAVTHGARDLPNFLADRS